MARIDASEYRRFVLSSWRYGGDPERPEAALHALAMLVSEVQEYLDNPTDDEAGDVCWACEALALAYSLPPLGVEPSDSPPSRGLMMRLVAEAAQAVQKMQQGADDAAWLPTLAGALQDVRDAAMGGDAETVLRGNMSKLLARYQGARYNATVDESRINKVGVSV